MSEKGRADKSISWDSMGRVRKFLTVRWNNWISFGVGIPVLVYAVFVLSTSGTVSFVGYLGMAVLGVIY